ncbi:MAG: ribose 5-phosphate isomerase B [Chitinophagales bacterium]|nr:ribose 5-phosphate isomerase B [Chitinophagales bacterium]
MKIAIGCDHAGFKMKEALKDYLVSKDHQVEDFGTQSEESVDYPDFVHPVCDFVVDNGSFGILLCGSANGVAMTANKHAGIRAAICWTEEITRLARLHNNANIICLPSRFISNADAFLFADTFFTTEFEGGRHQRRVNKIPPATISKQPD